MTDEQRIKHLEKILADQREFNLEIDHEFRQLGEQLDRQTELRKRAERQVSALQWRLNFEEYEHRKTRALLASMRVTEGE